MSNKGVCRTAPATQGLFVMVNLRFGCMNKARSFIARQNPTISDQPLDIAITLN